MLSYNLPGVAIWLYAILVVLVILVILAILAILVIFVILAILAILIILAILDKRQKSNGRVAVSPCTQCYSTATAKRLAPPCTLMATSCGRRKTILSTAVVEKQVGCGSSNGDITPTTRP